MKLCELDLIRMPLQIANQAHPVGLLLIAIPNSFENIFLRNLHYAGVSQQSTGQDHATQPNRGDQLGLREDEMKFYDALANNESAVRDLQDETLKKIAQELTQNLRENLTVDWSERESVRAKLRLMVKRILKKYKYPPDHADAAVQLVLEQAQALGEEWTHQGVET